ncbi:hypothetical protein PQG22_03755 [Aquirufa beregesia]
MNIQQLFYNFLTIVFSLIVFYRFKSYWPKYFETKGANQATKEDIGEITEIVETIKSDLLHQNELLKAQLSFKNQHRLNLKTAEREAIFDFNKRISAWLFSLIRFTFSVYNLDNYKELKIMSGEFSKRQYECDLAEAHLVLFMYDKKFLELKRDLTICIIELEGIVETAIHKIYGAYSKCEFNLEMDHDDIKKRTEHRDLLYKELKTLTDAYRTDSIEKYKQVHAQEVKMTQLINKRLKQLEDDEKSIS